jgi:LacI family transcriptional regulator
MPSRVETPTLADIARHTGVSLMTVSRSIRGVGRISKSTRDRVLSAASELGYRPNHAARSTANGRFDAVTIVLSANPRRSSLPRAVMEWMHDELALHRLHLNVAILPDEQLGDAHVVPELLRQTLSDGLIINYTDNLPPKLAELLDTHRLPAVWINHRRETDAVYHDDQLGAREAVGRLRELGHRRIMYADFTPYPVGEQLHYSTVDRREGYVAAMREAGLEPVVEQALEPGALRWERLSTAIQRHTPTAVVTYSGQIASVCIYAAAMTGMQVPRDLSVVAIDSRVVPYVGFDISTMAVQERRMGVEAARMLVRKLRSNAPAASVAIRPVWQPGESIASPVPGASKVRS